MTNNYIPNTSSIPNILFDYWMNKLPPAAFKILMCICRKTYGWHKDFDLISIKQIEKMTGLHRSGIIKNVDTLVKIGLLNKIKSKTSDGDDAPNRYEINVDCVEGGSLHSRLGVVDWVDPGVVYCVDPQKKDSTKLNLQNNTPPIPPQKAAEAAEFENAPKKKTEKQEFSPKVREVGNNLINSLKNAKEDYLFPKNLSAFFTEVDFLLRIDKRDAQKIYDVFNWALSDSFWADKMFKPNPAKYLREKFDQLEMKMKGSSSNTQSTAGADEKLGKSIVKQFPDQVNKGLIQVGHNYIEFINGREAVHIKFGEPSFRDRVLNELRKRGLVLKNA